MSQFPWARAFVAAGAALAFACPSAALADPPACTAIQFVVARGTSEPAGYSLALDGGLGNGNNPTSVVTYVRNELTNPTDGSTPMNSTAISRHDIDYPAEIPWPTTMSQTSADSLPFRQSVRKGTQKVIEFINAQHAQCPSQRYVLLGYSQGALVMMNAITRDLSKRIMMDGAPIPTLATTADAKIAAVATFSDIGMNQGDGRAVHAASTVSAAAPAYLQGTFDDLNRARNDGSSSPVTTPAFPRTLDTNDAFDSRIRTYCIKDDWICQGTGGAEQHLYYGDPAKPAPRRNLAIFVIQQLRNDFHKVYANTQCQVTTATDASKVGTTIPITFHMKGSVSDRVSPGTAATITNMKAYVTVDATSSTAVFAAMGNPAKIRKTVLFPQLDAVPVAGSASAQFRSLAGSNDDELPSGLGFMTIVPGGTSPSPWTVTWDARTSNVTDDLKFSSEFSAVFYGRNSAGANSGVVTLECSLAGLPSAEFGGRHFGRVVTTPLITVP